MSFQSATAAVVVTYFPNLDALERLLTRLYSEVDAVYVVDNGSELPLVREMIRRMGDQPRWVCLPDNRGVAAAQNIGLSQALRGGSKYALLFDQDSLPAEGMVALLVKELESLQAQGLRPAVIGPRYLDDRQFNPPPFVQSRGGRLQRMVRKADEPSCEVDYVISSGSLIPLAVYADVGAMDESLFIDYIDIDWGWRARAKGYRCFGAWDAQMQHDLGDEPVRVFGRAYPARRPQRYYYMFRNALLMLRRDHAPKRWKFVESYRLILRAVVWCGWGSHRRESWAAIRRGLRDGWRGVSGIDPKLKSR